MNNFHFWTQKVIPLVYDNSLSYYEVLAKVVYKLNECINSINDLVENGISDYIEAGLADSALADRIDALAENLSSEVSENTSALANTILKYDNFYKVTDLDGVTNDGTTDCYLPIRQLMDSIWVSGQPAIVYFPSGTYKNATGVIPIPPNTIVFGDGATSILYRSDVPSPTTDTGFFTPCGDNIVIYNLKIRLNVEDIPLQTGPLAVGIGVTNIAYPGIYPTFNVTRVSERKNIICDTIYSDGIYPLQAEIEKGTGVLKNIVFRNGTYDNGIVSMYPWYGEDGTTSPGNIGCLIENISCKWLRVGGRNSLSPNLCMYSSGLMVSNCKCKLAWLMADGILCNNLLVDASEDVTLDGTAVNYAVQTCGNVTITNSYLRGGGDSRAYGILNRSLDTIMLSGVTASGFTNGVVSEVFAGTGSPGNALMTNCNIGASSVHGYGVNTLATVSSNYKYFDFTKARFATLQPGTGITFEAQSPRVATFGTMAWIQLSCSSTLPWKGENVITVVNPAFRPVKLNDDDRVEYVQGVMCGTDQNGNPINKAVGVGTNGDLIPWATDNTVTSWSGVITVIYTLK